MLAKEAGLDEDGEQDDSCGVGVGKLFGALSVLQAVGQMILGVSLFLLSFTVVLYSCTQKIANAVCPDIQRNCR